MNTNYSYKNALLNHQPALPTIQPDPFHEVKSLYQKTFSISEKSAQEVVLRLFNMNLSRRQIKSIADFVASNFFLSTASSPAEENENLLFHAWAYPDDLPRTLQKTKEGNLYIFFNKCFSCGDPIVGKGTSKKAKYAVNLKTGELAVRISMENSKDHRYEVAMIEKLSKEQYFVQSYMDTLITYDKKLFNLPSIGVIQKNYNAQNLESYFPFDNSPPQRPLAPNEKELIASHLLKGLYKLHQEKQMIHLDIKPPNLLLSYDETTQEITESVLADYGFSCSLQDTTKRDHDSCSPIYTPPEYFYGNFPEHLIRVNIPARDMWSAGLLLFILYRENIPEWSAIKSPPWFSLSTLKELRVYMNAYDEKWLPTPQKCTPIVQVIQGLLRKNPSKRLTARKALEIFGL